MDPDFKQDIVDRICPIYCKKRRKKKAGFLAKGTALTSEIL
jgi:hypothetical protein